MAALTNKVALVTGASRGIGKAIALRFAQEGALVAVHYGKSRDEAGAVVAAITDAGGRAFALQADIGQVASIATLFENLDRELLARAGSAQFDILVNNAGVVVMGEFADTTEAQFDYLFDVNVKGLFFTTQQALPRLRDNGRIINLSSAVSRVVFPGVAAYSATKGAVDVLTRNFASLAGARGITVNSLAPGAIETDMNDWLKTPEGVQMVIDIASIKRVGKPEDIANAALLIASDDAGWVTANFIEASGGAKL